MKTYLSRNGISQALLLGFISICVFGCASTGARLDMSLEASDLIESGHILPDYVYYYSGPQAEPDAIVAVVQGIDFEQGLWQRVDLTRELLDIWNMRIDNRYRGSRFSYFGAYILDPSGRRVGLWYSEHRQPVISWQGKNKLIIHTPDSDAMADKIRRGDYLKFPLY